MPERDPRADLDPVVFRQAVEAAADGVVVTEAGRGDHPIVYVNPAFERLTGYRSEEVLGRDARFLQGDDPGPAEGSKLRRALADDLPCSVVLRNYRKDGSLFWNELTISPVRDSSGRTTHWLAQLRDVSGRMRLESTLREREAELDRATRALARLETHDDLTDAAGRRFFLEALAREWKRAARDGSPVSLLLVDVDDFERLNEARGHARADEILRQVAAALEDALKRPADLLARYAGDEFAALLPDTDAAGARAVALSMAERVRGLGLPGAEPAGQGTVTVSIGVATERSAPGCAAEELLARAGRALRRAREEGGRRVESLSGDEPALVRS